MKRAWSERPKCERIAVIVKLLLYAGVVLTFLLYYFRIFPSGNTVSWLLFDLHFFSDAILLWKTAHEEAVRSLCLGYFLSLMLSPLILMLFL